MSTRADFSICKKTYRLGAGVGCAPCIRATQEFQLILLFEAVGTPDHPGRTPQPATREKRAAT